jgi:predicted  nucleic acid-binding Zn-ribbon protein
MTDEERAAFEALGRERNTWARQMADLRDDLDTARSEVKAEAEKRRDAESERDQLERALEQFCGDAVTAVVAVDSVRLVLTRWRESVWGVPA